MIGYVARKFRERREVIRRTNEAYAQWYRSCFEGTPEEVEMKLYRWDSVHRETRPAPQMRSLFY